MPKSNIDESKLALYDKLVATQKGVERKGVSVPYTSLNGNMYSFMTAKSTLALRLSDADRLAFEKKYKTKPVVQFGALMKEYVAVPDALLAKTAELKKYFQLSLAYAKTLKPKKKS
jgi:hypothetical protein